jgi:hypothetical protein
MTISNLGFHDLYLKCHFCFQVLAVSHHILQLFQHYDSHISSHSRPKPTKGCSADWRRHIFISTYLNMYVAEANIKLSVCIIKQHTIKANMRGKVQLHEILTSGLDGGEWSASRPRQFTSELRAPGTHWIAAGCTLEQAWAFWITENSLSSIKYDDKVIIHGQ